MTPSKKAPILLVQRGLLPEHSLPLLGGPRAIHDMTAVEDDFQARGTITIPLD